MFGQKPFYLKQKKHIKTQSFFGKWYHPLGNTSSCSPQNSSCFWRKDIPILREASMCGSWSPYIHQTLIDPAAEPTERVAAGQKKMAYMWATKKNKIPWLGIHRMPKLQVLTLEQPLFFKLRALSHVRAWKPERLGNLAQLVSAFQKVGWRC